MNPQKTELFIYGLIAVVVLVLLFSLMKKLGLIKTKAQREATQAKQETRIEKQQIKDLLSDLDWFKPTVWQTVPAQRLYTSAYARSLADKIKNAFGLLNDKETEIYGVFRSLKDRANVSQIAFAYLAKYNKDLLGELSDRLNKSELQVIYNIINAI